MSATEQGAVESRYQHYIGVLERHGQRQLLAFWPQLDTGQRQALLGDLDAIDFERCAALVDPFVRNKPQLALPTNIDAADALPAEADATDEDRYAQARRRGADAIADGKVAAFVVAGGQGTRLGFDGPKGAYPGTPVRQAPLFQVFAESLLGVKERYGKQPPWYIMTSPGNHAATVSFFEEHDFFGLGRDLVTFFSQGQMPAFRPDGRIMLAQPHRVALSPDGHGGSLLALRRSGALDEMRARGIEHISYFQVDNPLVKIVDPLFVGLHIETGSEMSSKGVAKVSDTEKVGNFVMADGKLQVIEYSDLPDELAHAKNADGARQFDIGSIAIHMLDRSFVERLTSGGPLELPWHRAEKKVATIDERGTPVTPTEPNGVKLEMFVFDAIPLARNAMVMYTRREEEFSPIKNASGVDSAESSLRDQARRAARWLEAAGVSVPADATVEISPRYALDAADLRRRLSESPAPEIKPGSRVALTV